MNCHLLRDLKRGAKLGQSANGIIVRWIERAQHDGPKIDLALAADMRSLSSFTIVNHTSARAGYSHFHLVCHAAVLP
jgi:hypothetical protein